MNTQKLRELAHIWTATAPIWLLLFGVLFLWLGWSERDSAQPISLDKQKVYFTLASAVIGAGTFAALMKTLQFLKIFEDSLKSVIEQNYTTIFNAMDAVVAKNLASIEEPIRKMIFAEKAWLSSLSPEKLKEIFRDVVVTSVAKSGFPQLSEKFTNEMYDLMMPKVADFYYSRMHRRIELTKYDKDTDLLTIQEVYDLTINAHSSETLIPYIFKLKACWPKNIVEKPIKISFLTINKKDFLNSVRYKGLRGENEISVDYDFMLNGEKEYSVFRVMNRCTKISQDPVLHMVATRFTDSMSIEIDNRVSEHITVHVKPIGLDDKDLESSEQSPTSKRIEVKRLIYPRSGLLLVFEKTV